MYTEKAYLVVYTEKTYLVVYTEKTYLVVYTEKHTKKVSVPIKTRVCLRNLSQKYTVNTYWPVSTYKYILTIITCLPERAGRQLSRMPTQ